jgi:hypothetical protein
MTENTIIIRRHVKNWLKTDKKCFENTMTSEMTTIIRAIFGTDLSSKVYWIFDGVNIVNDLTICSTLPYRFGDVSDGGGDRKRAKLIFIFQNANVSI